MSFEAGVKLLRDNWPVIVAIVVIVAPLGWQLLHYLGRVRLEKLEEASRKMNDGSSREGEKSPE